MDEGTVRAVGAQGSGGPGAVGRHAVARVTRLAGRARTALRRADLRRTGPRSTGAGPADETAAAFLAEASAILASSLDPRHVVDFIASLTVPRLSDGIMIFLTAETAATLPGEVGAQGGAAGLAVDSGQIRLVATVHREARVAAYLTTAESLRPARIEDDFGPGLVVRTGQTWYLPYLPAWMETLIRPSELALNRFEDVTRGPVLGVPMPGAGRVLGVILATRVDRRFSDDDISLIEAFGRRAGLALGNAVVHHGALESALTLQRSLLPTHPPAIAGGELAMRYLPATAGTQVGGDLYDVVPLPDGRVGLAIGDVMGRGLGAAAQMGQLRAALRAFALAGTEPGDLLTGLARVASSLDVSFATCLYGVYDPATSRLRFASAGHFPPLLVIPGRPVAYAELEPGLCFGVDETIAGPTAYEETTVELPPGSAVLFFTDGLVESRRQPVDDGMEQLRAVLAGERPPPGAEASVDLDLVTGRPGGSVRPPALSPGRATSDPAHRPAVGWDPCRTPADLIDLALEAADSPELGEDDIAILALVTRGRSVALLDVVLDATETAPAQARNLLGDALRGQGLTALVDDARLLLTEIVTNAVRYARSDIRVSAGLDGHRLRVDVDDREGGVRPRPIRPRNDDEFGRGLLIVDAVARSWGVESTVVGKRVWFDLLDPDGGGDPAAAAPTGAV